MRTDLTEDQIARFREKDCLHYWRFLTADEVAEIRAAVLGVVACMGRRKVAGEGRALEERDDLYDRVFTRRINLGRLSQPFRAVVAAPALGQMLFRP